MLPPELEAIRTFEVPDSWVLLTTGLDIAPILSEFCNTGRPEKVTEFMQMFITSGFASKNNSRTISMLLEVICGIASLEDHHAAQACAFPPSTVPVMHVLQKSFTSVVTDKSIWTHVANGHTLQDVSRHLGDLYAACNRLFTEDYFHMTTIREILEGTTASSLSRNQTAVRNKLEAITIMLLRALSGEGRILDFCHYGEILQKVRSICRDAGVRESVEAKMMLKNATEELQSDIRDELDYSNWNRCTIKVVEKHSSAQDEAFAAATASALKSPHLLSVSPENHLASVEPPVLSSMHRSEVPTWIPGKTGTHTQIGAQGAKSGVIVAPRLPSWRSQLLEPITPSEIWNSSFHRRAAMTLCVLLYTLRYKTFSKKMAEKGNKGQKTKSQKSGPTVPDTRKEFNGMIDMPVGNPHRGAASLKFCTFPLSKSEKLAETRINAARTIPVPHFDFLIHDTGFVVADILRSLFVENRHYKITFYIVLLIERGFASEQNSRTVALIVRKICDGLLHKNAACRTTASGFRPNGMTGTLSPLHWFQHTFSTMLIRKLKTIRQVKQSETRRFGTHIADLYAAGYDLAPQGLLQSCIAKLLSTASDLSVRSLLHRLETTDCMLVRATSGGGPPIEPRYYEQLDRARTACMKQVGIDKTNIGLKDTLKKLYRNACQTDTNTNICGLSTLEVGEVQSWGQDEVCASLLREAERLLLP
ncbi:hypothetical protein DFP72DRAFT_848986 [Ephemerocybe angulata]|uniref:Uncharacterized protein n=1 Tax=Ephemerocybe angulata TaxID=980116 RepID=A0A8H6M5F6_9AGAR|nr:hypothetical protein DFP72DRAFT_848986 [Tulosesus angulatus]